MQAPKRILFVRFSSIGDIVLTTPVIRCVKQQTGAEIHYLTKESYAPVLAGNPYIDKVVTIREEIREVIPQLKSVRYDWIADLHHNLRTLRLKSALRRPGAAFPKLNVEKWLLTNFKIDLLPDLHIVDRYFKTVSRLGVQNDHAGLDFFISDEANVDIPGISNETIKPDAFIAMAIGAGRATKNLEDGQWLQLIDKMPLPVILLGGPADEDRGHQLAAHLSHCLNLAGKLSIQQSASVIAQSSCVISPDTGMMHIAAALKKPMLSVWGTPFRNSG